MHLKKITQSSAYTLSKRLIQNGTIPKKCKLLIDEQSIVQRYRDSIPKPSTFKNIIARLTVYAEC